MKFVLKRGLFFWVPATLFLLDEFCAKNELYNFIQMVGLLDESSAF
jgi:hypothetical protein